MRAATLSQRPETPCFPCLQGILRLMHASSARAVRASFQTNRFLRGRFAEGRPLCELLRRLRADEVCGVLVSETGMVLTDEDVAAAETEVGGSGAVAVVAAGTPGCCAAPSMRGFV